MNKLKIAHHLKTELLAFRQRNEKLGFVKRVKDLLGFGLKDGKDIADKLWQM